MNSGQRRLIISCVFLLCLLPCFDQLIPVCHGGRSRKDGFAPPLSTTVFHLQNTQQHPSPAQHFNPGRTNREIKKMKMRHDERGSQRLAGCGQVERREVLTTAEGRRAGWRFLISTGPLLHFLEHDAVFCGGKVRLVGEEKHCECNTCCLSFLFSHLCVSIFPVFLKGKHTQELWI